MTTKTCACGQPSVPGLISSVALCQKHFNDLLYGDWTSPEHKEAVAVMRNGPIETNRKK